MITITDSDVKKYLGSTTSLRYTDLEDAIAVITNRYIIPYLSQAQLLVSDVETSDIHIALMKVVKRAVVNLAFAKDYYKFALTSEVSAVKDKAAKETRASKEDKEYHRETFWLEGYASIDEMLQILEDNKTEFTHWANSPAFSQLKDSFVYGTTIYNKFVDINNSRRTFLRLKPAIYQLELYGMPQIINPDLRKSLLLKFNENTELSTIEEENTELSTIQNENTKLSTLEKEIIAYLQGFICNYSMAQTLKKGSIIKDAYNTFTVYDDTGSNKTEGRKTADKSLLDDVQKEYLAAAETCRNILAQTIAENMAELGLLPNNLDDGLNFKNCPKRGYFV